MREMGGPGVLDGMPGIGGGNANADTRDGAGKTGTEKGKEKEREMAFKAAWEAMLVEGMDGIVGDEIKPGELPTYTGGSGAGKEKTKEAMGDGSGDKQNFQAGIRAAMDKLKSSESGFKVRPLLLPVHNSSIPPKLTWPCPDQEGASANSNPTDQFEALFSKLNAAGLGELSEEVLAGEDGEENEVRALSLFPLPFPPSLPLVLSPTVDYGPSLTRSIPYQQEEIQGMLEMMMSSLMSKEVLHEPLKELGEKVCLYFPSSHPIH